MSKVFLTHVRIVDGSGKPAVEDGIVVYENKENGIVFVGEYEEDILRTKAPDDRVVDLKNEYTVLPGLINTHVHLDLSMPGPGFRLDQYGPAYRALKAYRRAAEALDCGVTTVRNCGGGDYFDLAIRKAVEKGMLQGPRVITCGWTLMAHGGHGSEDYGAIQCTGRDEFMREARKQLAKGVDMIKLGLTGGLEGAHEGLCDRQVTNEEIEGVVWAVHAAGKRVCAHLSDDSTIRDAIMIGLDSVEHGYAMSEETAKLIADKGKFYVPTMSVSSEDSLPYMIKLGFPEKQFAKAKTAIFAHQAAVRYAHKHGVKVCVGTDMQASDPVRGTNATVMEMELIHDFGDFSALETIKAATSTGAELLGLEKVTGTLKAGLEADIIAVHGKPDQNIRDMRNLNLVVKGGELVWSKLPGYEERGFNVVPASKKMEGGMFETWL